ncbi:MAG: hypothetical protein ABIF12_00435 [bacterium]
MKFIKIILLGLIFLNANPTNTTLFLDGSKNSEFRSQDITKLIKQIKNKNIHLKKIKINKKYLKNKKFDSLIDSISRYNQEINIIAIGYGIPILKIVLEYFKNTGLNFIEKAIIITNLNKININEIIPVHIEKDNFNKIIRNPIRTLKVAQKTRTYIGFRLFDPTYLIERMQTRIYGLDSQTISISYEEDEDADAEEDYISLESTKAESDFSEIKINDKSEINQINLSNKLILISSHEYLDLLELQRTDRKCFGRCSSDEINAITGVGSLIVSILALCI